MNRSSLIAIGTAVCLSMAAVPAYAKYDENDAKRDCESKISSDRRYKGLRNVHVNSQGNHSYKVTGKVQMDGKDGDFNCRIRHKEVVSWHIDSDSDSDSSGNTTAAIGAGVLAVAAIAALAASSDDNDDDRDHNNSRDRYRSGDDDAFEDMHYLKKECRQEIRRHLHQDHGAIDSMHFNNVHLNGRTLRGDGEVQFRRGRERDLSFTCEFDPRGRIHDGYYQYN